MNTAQAVSKTSDNGKVVSLDSYRKSINQDKPAAEVKPEPYRQKNVVRNFDHEAKIKHDAEPFRDKEDINKILTYFWDKHMKSWNTAQKYPNSPSRKWNPAYLRNYILVQIGCNCGLRASDLLELQAGDFIEPSGRYRDSKDIVEKKTLNTRKVLKARTVDINVGIISAMDLYKKFHPGWTREDYLFPNGYDPEGRPSTEPMTRQNMDLILKDVARKVGLQMRIGTHSLRKTLGREFIRQNGNNEEAILKAQVLFGHSSQNATKHYLGITRDEIRSGCMNLNIGMTMEDLQERGC